MRRPFDVYAVNYDDHFTRAKIGSAQRAQVHRQLKKILGQKGLRVLEVNCGTGEDAAWLAQNGCNVTATDISEGMLQQARAKTGPAFFALQQLAIQDVATLQPQKFDLVFSNFAGLNCLNEAELQRFAKDCAALQRQKGLLALVFLSKHCVWERLYYTLKKNSALARRRSNNSGVETCIDGLPVKTYYYSPKQVSNWFGLHYSVRYLRPIGLFVPPSYMEGYVKKNPRIFRCLTLLDELLVNFSALANQADHFLIVLEKKTIDN